MQYITPMYKTIYMDVRLLDGLEASSEHEPISNGDDDDVGDDRGGDTAGEEVLDVEVALAGSLVLHHDGSYHMLDSQQSYQENKKDLLMLGKPLVGKPIAPLAMSTAPMTSRFGCGCGML